MKPGFRALTAREPRLLPEGRLGGPMPWVIAIMMFLTVLAAAAGLGLAGAADRLGGAVGGRITVQVVEAHPDRREAQAQAAAERLRTWPGIVSVRRVPDAEIRELLEPWIGAGGLQNDFPVPALIDAQLAPGAAPDGLADLRTALADAAPAARLDDNAAWLSPLAGLIGALQWLAAGLVLLMICATGATVVIAARAALDVHRDTIEILHLMGATDAQVARLFQRKIALDTLFGGLIGFILAGIVLLGIGERMAAVGSELLGASGPPTRNWGLLLVLPVFGVFLAMLVARVTILRALGRLL